MPSSEVCPFCSEPHPSLRALTDRAAVLETNLRGQVLESQDLEESRARWERRAIEVTELAKRLEAENHRLRAALLDLVAAHDSGGSSSSWSVSGDELAAREKWIEVAVDEARAVLGSTE